MTPAMDRPPTSYLGAALGQMTAEMLEQQRQRDADQLPIEATDMAQQVHVDIKGKVGRKLLYTEVDVTWPYPFMMKVSQSQQESTLATPTFTPGIELKTADHVEISVYLLRWNENEAELIVGATVRIVVKAPEAPKLIDYDATVHMMFTGYAAPSEDDDTTTTTGP